MDVDEKGILELFFNYVGPIGTVILVIFLVILFFIYKKWDTIWPIISFKSNKRIKEELEAERIAHQYDLIKLEADQEAIMDENFKKGVEETIKVYSHMNILQRMLEADRVMIIEFHNDGTPPDGRNHGYITVPYEVNDQPLNMIRDKYQRFRGYDEHYNRMIAQLLAEGEYLISDVKQMEPCFLKNTYLEQGIKTVLIKKIKRVGTVLYFFSIQWIKPYDLYNVKIASQIPVFVSQMISGIGLDNPNVVARIKNDKRTTD